MQVPGQAWQIAIDARGEIRERRADDACDDDTCGHRACWIEEAHVTELTGLLRKGPGGDRLAAWPASMRVFARRERPHPGAQLTLFEIGDGYRYGASTSSPWTGTASLPITSSATRTGASLSRAAAYARGTQSANGWEFWQLQTRRERRPLKELRDELIRGER